MLSLALAGKPNAGKSTLFEAATMTEVDVANYPFTTIDPNRGVSSVRTDCPCLDREERCDSEHCRDGKRYVPVELLDVAGLVPGAHEGKGLGNQFLDELTTADAILNVVDASGGTNAEGERYRGIRRTERQFHTARVGAPCSRLRSPASPTPANLPFSRRRP